MERKEEYEVLSKTEQQIIELMKQNGKLSRKEIETKLELSTSSVTIVKKINRKKFSSAKSSRTKGKLSFNRKLKSGKRIFLLFFQGNPFSFPALDKFYQLE